MEVSSALSPGQAFLKIVHEELVRVMGAERAELTSLPLSRRQSFSWPVCRAGKTTTAESSRST